MKKYMVLKDFWGHLNVGEILSTEDDTISIITTEYSVTMKPSKMPQYFEEIKGQSLAEKVSKIKISKSIIISGYGTSSENFEITDQGTYISHESSKEIINLVISEVLKVFDEAYKEHQNNRYQTGQVSFIRKAIENMKSE